MARGVGRGVGSATPLFSRLAVAAGSGEATGTAAARAFREAFAAGDGTGRGAGASVVIVPAVRRDDADLRYDDGDELDLGTDSR